MIRMLVILCTLASAACFSDDPDDPMAPDLRGEPLVEIRLTDFSFTPASVTISPGTRVRWINTTNTFHTVTPDGHAEWQSWSTSTSSDTLEHVFASEGAFAYFCQPHRSIGMTGTVTVR